MASIMSVQMVNASAYNMANRITNCYVSRDYRLSAPTLQERAFGEIADLPIFAIVDVHASYRSSGPDVYPCEKTRSHQPSPAIVVNPSPYSRNFFPARIRPAMLSASH